MKQFSLRFRISILVFVITNLLIVLITVLIINDNKKRAEADFIDHSLMKADMLSDNCLIPLVFYPEAGSLEFMMEKFRNYPTLQQCIIYDNSGNKSAVYLQNPNDEPYTGRIYQDSLFFTGNNLLLFLPIEYNARKYGTIFLMEDTIELYSDVLFYGVRASIIALILMIISFIITRNLLKNVSAPLLKLLEATEHVSAEGNFSQRLEKRSLDEMGRLYKSFNQIMEHLELGESEKSNIKQELKGALEQLRENREEIINLMHTLSAEIRDKNATLEILEETRQRFDLAVAGSSDGLWDWKDIKTKQQWWSPRYYQLLHYEGTELKPSRSNFVQLIHPSDKQDEAEMLIDHLENNEHYDIRLRLKTKAGDFRWFRVRGQALWDENSNPVRMSGSLQDINEQQELKEQMKYHITELETISHMALEINKCNDPADICRIVGEKSFELNPGSFIAVTLYDPHEKAILFLSDFGFENYMSEITRIVGMNIRELRLYPQENIEEIIPEVKEKTIYKMENGIYDLLGHTVSQTVCKLLLRFLGVEEVYHIGFGINGTASGGLTLLIPAGAQLKHREMIETLMNYSNLVIERIYTNQELQEKQEQLNLAIESTEQGMWDWNIVTNELAYNKYWFDMLGYKASDFDQENYIWESLLHPDDAKATLKLLDDHIQNKSEKYVAEYRLKTSSGTWKWVHAQGRVMEWSEDNKPVRMLGSHIDIDIRKRAEEEIRKLNEELEERVRLRTAELEKSNRELEEFSYTISHDLRAPLRAIGGFAEILIEEYEPKLDQEAKGLLSMIVSNIRMMGQLIDDLLYYVRLSRLPVEKTTLDLALIAWNAYNHLQIGEIKKDVDLTISDLKTTSGTGSQIKLLFSHLLENSIKYRHRDRKLEIVIGSRKINEKLYYFVSDNGIGFNMEYVHNIFKIFHRLHTIDEYEGTGVGLALVKRIVEKHGGDVFAESEPGKGTTIYFSLPEQEEEKNTAPSPKEH